MRFAFFSLILLVSPLSAGDLDLIFNTNGPSCKHVAIKDKATGQILEVTTEDELRAPINGAESSLLNKIKSQIEVNNLTTNLQIETSVETMELPAMDLIPPYPNPTPSPTPTPGGEGGGIVP